MNESMYREALTEFTSLPLDEKKKKLLALIEKFENAHPIFEELSKDLQAPWYTDNQYIQIYKILLKSTYEVEQEGLAIAVQRMEQLHNFLVELKAKEIEQNKKDGDIDARLDKVLATLQ